MEMIYSSTEQICTLTGIFVAQLICAVAIMLLLKFAFKVRWQICVCFSIMFGALLPWAMHVFGISPLGGRLPRGGGSKIFFLTNLVIGAICLMTLIIQLFRWIFSGGEDSNVNAAERERTLRMVEEGKITAEESAELLEAMGRSNAMRGQDRFTRLDVLVLFGVAMVILGFFLPWVHIRMQLDNTSSPLMPGLFGLISGYQAGYHTGAIGWAVFVVGLLMALPVFITPRDFLYKISMLQIFIVLIGVALTVRLLIGAWGNMGAGLWVCLVGFVVTLVGAATKFRRLAA